MIIFHALSPVQLRKIVVLQIARLAKQLAGSHIELEVSPEAISAIAEEGYDPTFGARPIKRVIQQKIQNPLAVELLKQEVQEGTRVRVDFRDGEYEFERVAESDPTLTASQS